MAEQLGNDKDLDGVIGRIKKLLNLATSPNEHEAASAAARAKKLMDKYNIAISEVITQEITNGDDSNVIDEELFGGRVKKQFPVWLTTLAIRVSELFDTKIRYFRDGEYNQWAGLEILGYKSDVEVTKYVFVYLHRTIHQMSLDTFKRLYPNNGRPPKSWLDSYRMGSVHSIVTRLKELYPKEEEVPEGSTGTGLMVLKEAAITRKFGEVNYNSVEGKEHDEDAYALGHHESEKIRLNKGIAENA